MDSNNLVTTKKNQEQEKEYFIDEILAKLINTENNETHYIIKWLGYPYEDSHEVSEQSLKLDCKEYQIVLDEFNKRQEFVYNYCFTKVGGYFYSTRIIKKNDKEVKRYIYDFWWHNYSWVIEKKGKKPQGFNFAVAKNMEKITEICVLDNEFKSKKPKRKYYSSKDFEISFEIRTDNDQRLPEVYIKNRTTNTHETFFINQVVLNGNFGYFNKNNENLYKMISDQSLNEKHNGHGYSKLKYLLLL